MSTKKLSDFLTGGATVDDSGNVTLHPQWSLAASWTYSGTAVSSVPFAGLALANQVMIECVAVTTSGAAAVEFLVSADNGATYYTSGYRRTGTSGVQVLDAAGFLAVSGVTGSRNPWVIIENWNLAYNKIVHSACGVGFATNQMAIAVALNALQLTLSNAASFTGGTINIYTR